METAEPCDIVIPAYNEAGRISATLQAYLTLPSHLRLIVSLDGCTDNTREVVEAIRAQHPNRVRIIENTTNKGKGAAVRAGWAVATAPWVGFVDADNATPPEQFMRIWNAALENTAHSDAPQENASHQGPLQYDAAIGSRLAPGAVIHDSHSLLRRRFSRWFATTVRTLFNLPIHDLQCGAKMFRRTTLAPLLPLLKENGMTFDIELLWQLQQHGTRITEVPIEWTDQPGSATFTTNTAFLRQGLRMLRQVVALRWRLRGASPRRT